MSSNHHLQIQGGSNQCAQQQYPPQVISSGAPASQYGHYVPQITSHYPIPSVPSVVVPNHYPTQGYIAPQGQYPSHGLESHHVVQNPSSYTPSQQPYNVQQLQVPQVYHPHQPVVTQAQYLPHTSVSLASGSTPISPLPVNISNAQYMCSSCGQTFTRSDSFHRHARTFHEASVYSCRCGKTFSREDSRKRHWKSHPDHATH